MNFWSDDGLLNSKPSKNSEENAYAYTVDYLIELVGSHRDGISLTIPGDVFKFITEKKVSLLNYVLSLKTDELGLLNQRTRVEGNHEDYTSPDQLLAFIGTLSSWGYFNECKAIWHWLLTHWFTYDNIGKKTNFKRIMQPMVILAAGSAGSTYWWWLFRPLLSIAMIYSCISKPNETSGKLKARRISMQIGMRYTFRVMSIVISLGPFKTWAGVSRGYYKHPEHPIRKFIDGKK